ncbi:hypothetical protein SAMN04487898_10746 [Pedobacter sp. ok626]|uniref:hypothetical protein n=1 Tax=Pedobacter sp. ok626 TaxID=1761882 RepID=UPI00088A6CA2|nr:hypothetical protein [Pedobacter sp. ok626]SDK26517.1 hypothetical protein SAMN04487898_10746 [Pedobacter sp. ok626]
MNGALNGTRFSYTNRNTVYNLELEVNDYLISTNDLSTKSKESFGANKIGNIITSYSNNEKAMTLQIETATSPVLK